MARNAARIIIIVFANKINTFKPEAWLKARCTAVNGDPHQASFLTDLTATTHSDNAGKMMASIT
jgi:hypothetical protein